MNCDMCGKDTELYRVDIEGTIMNVCRDCSSYGKVIGRLAPKKVIVKAEKAAKPKDTPQDTFEQIVTDYSARIKDARERKGLKQEELAKILNEKESLIHHVESGRMKPSITLARKMERFLGIKLVEVYQETGIMPKAGKDPQRMTLADIPIKIRKR